MPVSVLVVEDDDQIRARVQRLLEREGYEVHAAGTPREALALLSHISRPCILLWDGMTPREALSMLDDAALQGVHVATLPVSLLPSRGADPLGNPIAKRLTSEEAILSVVRAYCPLEHAANG
jgi:CheY-like chemotaxis protein